MLGIIDDVEQFPREARREAFLTELRTSGLLSHTLFPLSPNTVRVKLHRGASLQAVYTLVDKWGLQVVCVREGFLPGAVVSVR